MADRAEESLPDREIDRWRAIPAVQQPEWDDPCRIARTRAELAGMPGLVGLPDVRWLRALLADVALGRRQVVQAGDCAEDPSECVPEVLAAKLALLDTMAWVMQRNTGLPVVRVGRIAGQFTKPRSGSVECQGGQELPVFRGHAVNSPQPFPLSRRADPVRLLTCYHAAASALAVLRNHPAVFTSHEALLLDYELPLLRRCPDGTVFLSSTHWPWIGDRTRQPDGAHVAFLGTVVNPVACKVGPTATVDSLLAVCERLDPHREPGRLTLVARLGADAVTEALPALAAAVRSAGHPVIWLCDPMHGNTVTSPTGRKTRYLEQIVREVRQFYPIVLDAGAVAGGLHLEVTPEPVTECVPDDRLADQVDVHYTTACDPRLNPEQAVEVTAAWGPVAVPSLARTEGRVAR